jgi:chaperonin GroES
MKIQPKQNQVIVKQHMEKETTAGGLYIPTTAQKKLLQGEVLSVGPGKVLDNGTRLPPDVKEGDVVLFPPHSYVESNVDGEDYIIIREDNILGVLVKE